MHAAPAHLEAKLRFADFTVGQIAGAFAGILLGFAWVQYVSPIHGMLGLMSGAYLAALPVIPIVLANQTEFDLAGLVANALRWRRLNGRYVPGAGTTATGYMVVLERQTDHDDPGNELELDLHALWETATPSGEKEKR